MSGKGSKQPKPVSPAETPIETPVVSVPNLVSFPVSYLVNKIQVDKEGQLVDVDVFQSTVEELSGMGFAKALHHFLTNGEWERVWFFRQVVADLSRSNLLGHYVDGEGLRKGRANAETVRNSLGLPHHGFKYADSHKDDDGGYFQLYPYMGTKAGVLSVAIQDKENKWTPSQVAWVAALVGTFPALGSFTTKFELVKPSAVVAVKGTVVKSKQGNGFGSGLLSKLNKLTK